MIACTPISDSCSSREREGETTLWPAVPMKSPIKLISGLRSLAFEEAPPKVCVWATCGGAGSGAGASGAEAGESMPGETRAEVSRTCAWAAGSGDLASRSASSSPRSSATCSASVRTCSSSVPMRVSAAEAAADSGAVACLCGFSCAGAATAKKTRANRIAIFVMAFPQECKTGFRIEKQDLLRGSSAGRGSTRGFVARYGGHRAVGPGTIFEPAEGRCQRDARRRRHDGRARGSAERAKMRAGGFVGQVRTKMELRREKNDPEEQCQAASRTCFAGHVLNETEFRQERLRSQ